MNKILILHNIKLLIGINFGLDRNSLHRKRCFSQLHFAHKAAQPLPSCNCKLGAVIHNFSVGCFLSLKSSQLLQLPDCYPAISSKRY